MPQMSKPITDGELRYYYSGFLRVLRRSRRVTVIGWMIVAAGCASFPIGWSMGRPGGVVEIVLSCATIVAGIMVVWQSVSSLEMYIRIVPPLAQNGEQHAFVHDVVEIMKDVDEGGWQETHAAIRRLEELQVKYGLPPAE